MGSAHGSSCLALQRLLLRTLRQCHSSSRSAARAASSTATAMQHARGSGSAAAAAGTHHSRALQMPGWALQMQPAAATPARHHVGSGQPSSRQHHHHHFHAGAPLLARQPRSWQHRFQQQPPPGAGAAAAAAGFTGSMPCQQSLAGPQDDDDGPEGELHAVETAIRANALIFAAKLSVFFISNSSAMLAEAVHSVVDIANQMLLRIGIKKAQKEPSEQHPYGYARDQFIWPLISAVGIFCCGAGVSFVHGVSGLFEAEKVVGDLFWNFVVLGVSAVLESHSLYVAVDTLRRRATQQGMSLLAYIKTGADPAATAVMMEDGAAVAGLFIAGGCLALCQVTGAVVWDSVGSIAVSGLLGVVAVTLIQRNRKWLIGKSMPKAQEDQILAHLLNDHVIRHVSNIKSEELGVRQYRFQADIAFDGEELARRALDRCGRVRLFKALDAAIRRHDPHALDALLMQFAAVIVSTTGAEVDRLEREIVRIVPGTRWVDLETDRGRPARLSSAYAAAAAAAAAASANSQANLAPSATAAVAALGVGGHQAAAALQQQQQQQQQQDPPAQQLRPLDSPTDQDSDHLSDLDEYPLGSLASWDDAQLPENVPEWIRSFTPDPDGGPYGGGAAAAAAAATAAAAAATAAAAVRLGPADAAIVGGNYLSHEEMHAIESVLLEGHEAEYKPFCNQMLEKLQPSNAALAAAAAAAPAGSPATAAAAAAALAATIRRATGAGAGSGSSAASPDSLNLAWEVQQQPRATDAATAQQLADWASAETNSWAGSPDSSSSSSSSGGSGGAAARFGLGPGSAQSFCDIMAAAAAEQQAATAAASEAPGAATAAASSSSDAGGGSSSRLPLLPDEQEQQQWGGQEGKRRSMQKLLELEDSVLARDGPPEAKPFCESMFQALHPDQPTMKGSVAAARRKRRQQQQQQQAATVQQQLQDEQDLDVKEHQG